MRRRRRPAPPQAGALPDVPGSAIRARLHSPDCDFRDGCGHERVPGEADRDPLRHRRCSGRGGASRRRPGALRRPARRPGDRALAARARRRWPGRRWAASRAPTCATTSTSPAARGACSTSPKRMVGEVRHGRRRCPGALRAWLHQRRPNRANIAHHYDVSNAFYRLWLDERMVYSCAYFRRDDDTLDDAQAQKLDHICRKLRLAPGQGFLDIGCGWGALIFHAAEHYGVRATGITLSQHQLEHVREEIGAPRACRPRRGSPARLPRPARGGAVRQDRERRDVRARGRAPLRRLLRHDLHRVLKPGGLVLNHGITHNGLHGAGPGQRHRRLRRATTCSRAASSRTSRA